LNIRRIGRSRTATKWWGKPEPGSSGSEQDGAPFKQVEFDINVWRRRVKVGELVDLGVKARDCPKNPRRLGSPTTAAAGAGTRELPANSCVTIRPVADEIEMLLRQKRRADCEKFLEERPQAPVG